MNALKLTVYLALLTVIAIAGGAAQAGKTPWQQHEQGVRSRVIIASDALSQNGMRLAGLEIEMSDGWKTYWRSPGEAGLPITLTIDGKPVDLLFPLPKRIEFYDIHTFAYAGSVVVPFYIGEDAVKAGVDVASTFMICDEICIPLQADFQTSPSLLDAAITEDLKLQAWMKKVPQRGRGAFAGLSVDKALITGRPGRQRLIVDAEVADYGASPDLLAEAGSGFQFGLPKVLKLPKPAAYRFVFKVLAPKKQADLRGHDLRLTLTDGGGDAIDRTVQPEAY